MRRFHAPLATYWASPGGCTASTGYLGPVQGTSRLGTRQDIRRAASQRVGAVRRLWAAAVASVQVRTLIQVIVGSAELAGRGGSEGGRARCPLTGGGGWLGGGGGVFFCAGAGPHG